MYHIGIRIGLFLRRVKVKKHEWHSALHYVTAKGHVVTIPTSAIKKFVVYADYWQHEREAAEKEPVPEVDGPSMADVLAHISSLQGELKRMQEERHQPVPQYTQPQAPRVAPRPQVTDEEAMESEVMRRARERMNGFQSG